MRIQKATNRSTDGDQDEDLHPVWVGVFTRSERVTRAQRGEKEKRGMRFVRGQSYLADRGQNLKP